MADTAPTSRQQELSALRQATAKATLAGPSKEAQALMSDRTKTILGTQKLQAGIQAQQNVERMKSEIGNPPATVAASVPPATSTSIPQSPKPPVTPAPAQTKITPEQEKLYQRAYENRNNPFAKGTIRSKYSQLTPEQKKAFQEYAKSRGDNWNGILPEEYINISKSSRTMQAKDIQGMIEAYASVYSETEQVDENLQQTVEKGLDAAANFMKTNPVGRAVGNIIKPVGQGRKTPTKTSGGYRPVPVVKEEDLFDLIKGHLMSEGYAETEEAALKIMSSMSEEWKQSIVEQIAPSKVNTAVDLRTTKEKQKNVEAHAGIAKEYPQYFKGV